MSFIKIALRNIPRRKLRNVLTIMAIVLSIALLVGISVATNSASEGFEEYIGRTWGETDIIVTYGAPGLTFQEENLSLLRSVDGIDKATARLGLVAFVNGDCGKVIEARGIDPDTDYVYESYKDVISGDWKVSGDNVVASQALCDNYGLKIGDNLSVTIEKSALENGKLYNLVIIGIFKSTERIEPTERVEFNQLYFFIDLDHLQSISDLEGQINSMNAKVTDVEKTGEVKEKLQKLFGHEFEVHTPKIEAVDRMKSMTKSFNYGLDVMVTVSLIACMFLVFNTMFITVKERTYEIGVLRSMGSSGFQIFRMFFSESLLLGVVGISLGIIGGLGLAKFFIWLFKAMFPQFPGIASFVLTPTIIQMSILVGFIAVFGGALYPAISASRTSVDQALRPSMRFGRRKISTGVYLAIGLILFAFGAMQHLKVISHIQGIDTFTLLMGAIMITAVALFNVSTTISKYLSRISRSVGMLVSRNVGRKILRNAVCFGIIGITLSFIIILGGIKVGVVEAMESGVRESFGADIILMGKSNQNFPTTFTENLISLDDVNVVTPTSVVIGGTKCLKPEEKSIGVFVIDPETFPNIIQYDFIDPRSPDEVYKKLKQDNEALILPKSLAKELGVLVGDNLTLQTWIMADNKEILDNTDYTVAGIFTGAILQHVDIAGHLMSESVVIPFSSEAKHFYPKWGEGRAWSFFVDIEPGADSAKVLKQIDDAYPQYGFGGNSLTLENILEGARTYIDRIFYILFSTLYFSVIISAMAIAIAMVMSVIERKREIGILRSQGIGRGQMLSMFLGEAIVIGLIGFAMGIPCGWIILEGTTTTMAFDGLNIRTILPSDAIVHALIIAIAAAMIGGLYPAYKASKLTVVESLQQK